MKVIDLSHEIHAKMPVFPGTEPPRFEPANTLESDGFVEKKITMYSHTGTHVDAPYHMLRSGMSLDNFEIEHFMGRAAVIDVSDVQIDIEVHHLLSHKEKIGKIDYLILKTGWSKYWGSENYFKGFPALTAAAAHWLADYQLRGIGVDTISIDTIESTTFPVHHILFEKNLLVIENLMNLDAISTEYFIFSCTPLKTLEADGSPTRAIAIEKNRSVATSVANHWD